MLLEVSLRISNILLQYISPFTNNMDPEITGIQGQYYIKIERGPTHVYIFMKYVREVIYTISYTDIGVRKA